MLSKFPTIVSNWYRSIRYSLCVAQVIKHTVDILPIIFR